MKVKLVVQMMAAAVFAAAARGDTLTFGTEESPVSGTQVISAGTTASGIKAYVAEGETLVLTNGDVTLSAPESGVLPKIEVVGGKLCVASGIAAPDGLRLKGGLETIVRTNYYPQAWNHSPTATLFATARNIDDFIPIEGKRTSGNQGSTTLSPVRPGYPYCVKRTSGELTFEMQYIDDYLRSIKVRLFQDGDDIYAQVMWARYGHAGYGYGYSLEEKGSYVGEVPIHSQTHVPSDAWNIWFGVHTLALQEEGDETKAISFVGDLDVSGNIEMETTFVSVNGTGDLADTLSVPISLSNATLRVRRGVATTIGSDITSLSYSRLMLGGEGTSVERSGAIVTIGTTKSTVLTGVFIEDLDVTGAYVRQKTSAAITGDRAWFGHCEHTPTGIVFQAQGWSSDNWNKCALVRLWQDDGTNIAGQVIGRPYNRITTTPLGTDMRIAENVLGQGEYNATNITYTYMEKTAPIHLTGTATNGASLNVTVESNAVVKVESAYAFPKASLGTVTIEDGADVWWTAGNPASAYLPSFCVRGCLFYQKSGYRDGSYYNIDGGLMALYNLGEAGSTSEAGQYLNKVTFRNGGRLIGRRPRIGYAGTCKWEVSGDAPSYWESGGRLVGNGNSTKEGTYGFTVQVADVTGDDESDFISTPAAFSGYTTSLFTDYNSNLMRLKVIKTGAGTWEWNAKGGSWTGRLIINEGAVRFDKSDTMSSSGLGVRLNGGELQLSDATTNSIPKLEVLADSSLRLGEDALVAFPDETIEFASGTCITNDVTLSVYGPNIREGSRTGVRFGSSACLAAETISKIRYNDFYVTQDAEGWIRSASHGTMVIFK